MNLRSQGHGDVSLLQVSGEIDLANSTDLRNRIRQELLDRKHGVVVELGEIEHIDSSGIAVLIEGKGWAKRAERGFVLARPSERVRMVIELARLDQFFAIEDEPETAVERAKRREIE